MFERWRVEMIRLKQITSVLLISMWAIPGFTAVDEESILLRKAALVAQKVHYKNVALLGMDPKTCKPTQNKKLMISQLGQIKTGKLNHCPEYLKEKLAAIDEEIKNVEKGVLVYAPLVAPVASSAPMERLEDSDPLPEIEQVSKESSPEVTMRPGKSDVDFTGLDGEQRSRILIFQEENREQYTNNDDDNLFNKLSNAYMRNLPKIMSKPQVPENQE